MRLGPLAKRTAVVVLLGLLVLGANLAGVPAASAGPPTTVPGPPPSGVPGPPPGVPGPPPGVPGPPPGVPGPPPGVPGPPPGVPGPPPGVPGPPPGVPGPPAQGGRPAPHVEPFADGLTGQVRSPGKKGEIVSEGPNLDGCDAAYSDGEDVCVPETFPAGVTNKCAWLKERKYPPITVKGSDRHGLVPPGAGGPRAPNGRSFACPAELGTG